MEAYLFVVARTEAGLVRDENQDRYLVWELGVDGAGRAGKYVFCAVADGMGGSAAGDQASALTLATVAERLLPLLVSRCGEPDLGPCDVPRVLEESIRSANRRVSTAASADASLRGMGTTLTAGLTTRGVLYLAQVGDSRCYRLRAGLLEQQTTDHSFVGELVRMGKLTASAARHHPRRNIITRAVGVQEDLKIDTSCSVLEEDDIYLFCSDGLWEMVPDETIMGILARVLETSWPRRSKAMDRACADLVAAALAGGGTDNVTAVVATVEKSDIHTEAVTDWQSFARTRVETGEFQAAELKKTLRHRLQEWQQ